MRSPSAFAGAGLFGEDSGSGAGGGFLGELIFFLQDPFDVGLGDDSALAGALDRFQIDFVFPGQFAGGDRGPGSSLAFLAFLAFLRLLIPVRFGLNFGVIRWFGGFGIVFLFLLTARTRGQGPDGSSDGDFLALGNPDFEDSVLGGGDFGGDLVGLQGDEGVAFLDGGTVGGVPLGDEPAGDRFADVGDFDVHGLRGKLVQTLKARSTSLRCSRVWMALAPAAGLAARSRPA